MSVIRISDTEDLVPTKTYPYATWPFENFNKVQGALVDHCHNDTNVVVAAATSCGKTLIAEMYMADAIRQGKGKAVYIGPLKALAKEKIDDWTNPSHHFSDLNISICTGDYRLTQSRVTEMNEANIIVMTPEMLASKVRNHKSEKSTFLQNTNVIVFDECFPSNTKIRVAPNIDLPIIQIIKNDDITHVLSYDETTNSVVYKKILRKITNKLQGGLISINHEYGKFTCTKTHKIWVEGKGYVKAEDLQPEDRIKWIPQSDSLICPICNKVFGKKRFLTSHYLYSHVSVGKNTNHIDNKITCSQCDKEISVYGYQSHIKYCGQPKKNKYTPKSRFCSMCGKEFTKASSRHIHEQHHNKSKEFYEKLNIHKMNSPIWRTAMKAMGKKIRGKNNPIFRNPASLEKLKQLGRDRWKNLSEDEKLKQIKRFINAPLNKTEGTSLELLLEEAVEGLPIRRVSGGKFWLTFKNGKHKNPDFKCNGIRKVVEIGDTEYWHTPQEIKETVKNYSDIGYECLYLTNKDAKKGVEYLRSVVVSFLNNHSSKIISVKNWGKAGIEEVYNLEIEDTHNYFANGVLVSNCHLLTVPSRGDHIEVALMKMTEINPNVRVVLLSATMPNVDELAAWVCKLTKRDTVLLESNYRPCPLNIHYETYYDGDRKYEDKEIQKVGTAAGIVEYYHQDKFLVFVHTKRTGRLMVETLAENGVKAEFHNADLDLPKRLSLEKRFKEDPDFRVIVATSTLAWGLNLPARRVIIVGIHRGMSLVENYDIWQECGRAGRPQYDPRGDAYILVPESGKAEAIWRINQKTKIKSQLLEDIGGHHKTLAFHVVSEIHHGGIRTKEGFYEWFRKSLAHHQDHRFNDHTIDKVIDLLVKCKAITCENNEYKATPVGIVASMFYYSPFDVSDLRKNFGELFDRHHENDNYAIAGAMANIDSYRIGIVNKAERAEMSEFQMKFESLYGRGKLTDSAMKTAFAYHNLLNGKHNEVLNAIQSSLRLDLDRTMEVLNAVDSMASKWDKREYFSTLRKKLVYGVGEEALDLCQIPSIGKARSDRLLAVGIKTLDDFCDADPDNLTNIMKLRGKGAIEKILKEAKLIRLRQQILF